MDFTPEQRKGRFQLAFCIACTLLSQAAITWLWHDLYGLNPPQVFPMVVLAAMCWYVWRGSANALRAFLLVSWWGVLVSWIVLAAMAVTMFMPPIIFNDWRVCVAAALGLSFRSTLCHPHTIAFVAFQREKYHSS